MDSSLTLRSSPTLQARHWLLLLLALSTVLISITKLIPGIEPGSPMRRYYEPVPWWLLPHVGTGVIALLAGPLQFSNRLRRSRPQLHRSVGMVYLVAVFCSAPFAVT